jgi:hypothetical protein
MRQRLTLAWCILLGSLTFGDTVAGAAPARPTEIRSAILHSDATPADTILARKALASVVSVRRSVPTRSQSYRELTGVLQTITSMARRKQITAVRLPMLTETLRGNAEWWKARRTTLPGARPTVPGSPLVWQYYPGSGVQIQWLGTFGQGNYLVFSGKKHRPALTTLVDEALRLSIPRGRALTWESFFDFNGGAAPWVSGMSAATGAQVLSRAAAPLGRPELIQRAHDALIILQMDSPRGVRRSTSTGTHYLLYSFSRTQAVLNAHAQTLNGIYAYLLVAPDDVQARLLFLDGLRWLDANLDAYDTGRWSLYALKGELASEHYHLLARDFLKTLCSLLHKDASLPGGGPSGASDPALVCAASEQWTAYAALGKPRSQTR